MTAQDLLTKLTAIGCAPAVDGPDLLLTSPPPADLEPVIGILQCSLRALLTARNLYAMDNRGKPIGPGCVINPKELLPADVRLVAVEGPNGGEWDRIHPLARESYPALFAEAEANATKKPNPFKIERAR